MLMSSKQDRHSNSQNTEVALHALSFYSQRVEQILNLIGEILFSLYMKVSNILAISLIIRLQHKVMLRNIFSVYMKVSLSSV